ncbi:hypothetical protein PCASD_22272 [Puccinia coronata f. sp. avenae]|uniref:Uncharacterized protein n=1 Tax=Puccinia coronata f. sp. avenae TaxID=200324 RepID=A0A2N5SBL3_9BASI|nr:hypothetical protein PCASD_22272 [Puccinia coronata f. sp. avenae]
MSLTASSRWNASHILEQKTSVLKGFLRLLQSCEPGYDRATDTTKSIDEDASIRIAQKKERWNRLHSVLLPLLDRQITNLSELLHPSDLQQESASKFELLLGIQCDLEDTINQVRSAQDTLFLVPVRAFPAHFNNDQHLHELKPFRLRGLKESLESLYASLYAVFERSTHMTKRLMVSSPTPNADGPSSPIISRLERKVLIGLLSSSRDAIKLAIEWIFSLLTNLSHNKERNHQSHQAIEKTSVNLLSEPVLQVVKSLIPVIKLSRLFYKKSTQRAVNGSRRPFVTEIDSRRLDCLSGTASSVRFILQKLLQMLKDNNPDVLDGPLMVKEVNRIQICLEEALFSVMLYFVPLILETQGFPDQKHYNSWFIVWFSQLNLAVQNFIDVAELL